MAVRDDQVLVSILIDIDKLRAPGDVSGIDREPGSDGLVGEEKLAEIAVQRSRGLVDEVGADDIDLSVIVVIGRGQAHSALFLSILSIGHAGGDSHVGEGAVMIVAVKDARRGVAGDVDVGPAVVVEIGRSRAETVVKSSQTDARRGGHIPESAIPFVVEQVVDAGGEAARSAEYFQTQPVARIDGGSALQLRKREGGVIGHEDVEEPVAIVIEKRAARIE